MTQDELASAIGTSRNSVALYETAKHLPGADALAGLHRAGVDIVYVLTGESAWAAQDTVLDLDAMAFALEQVRKQAGLSKEAVTQRDLLDEAWEMYQSLLPALRQGTAKARRLA